MDALPEKKIRIPIPLFRRRQATLERTSEVNLQSQIEAWWSETYGTSGLAFSPRLFDRVWAANRCMQLNCQQISAMPLRFFGSPSSSEPAWLSNPDPVWHPNGISSALFAATWHMYAYGDAFLYVTSEYSDGFPSQWTVLDSSVVNVTMGGNGRRQYKVGDRPLDASRVVQITRDPRGGLRGTSALAAYAANTWNLTNSAEATGTMISAAPPVVLKATKKITPDQAEDVQDRWMSRAGPRRLGVPPVLPPDIELAATNIGLSPKDLLLLDSQEFDARVIASAFGVPAFLLNLPLVGGLTYQNPAMLFEVWWRSELKQAAKRFSDAFSAQMLPRGQWVEFDARETLAPDFKELVETWEKIIAFGGGTVAEFRASVLRLPPQSPEDSLEDMLQPSVAASSQNGNGSGGTVASLRPMAGAL